MDPQKRKPSAGKVMLRRTLIALALIAVLLVPALIMLGVIDVATRHMEAAAT